MKQHHTIFEKLAEALLIDYYNVYYLDPETGSYVELRTEGLAESLRVTASGSDFYEHIAESICNVVKTDEQEMMQQALDRKTLMQHREKGGRYSLTYQRVLNGRMIYARVTIFPASDHRHLILCASDCGAEATIEEALRKGVTYSQIAESLASQYDVLYYVDSETKCYTQYTTNPIYGSLEVRDSGEDFFEESRKNSEILIHPDDRARFQEVISLRYMTELLKERKQFQMDYRMLVDGKELMTRLTILWASDRVHFILGVENIEEEARRQREQRNALNLANELARRDILTGVKNKTAFEELEQSVQSNIDSGMDYLPFAIVVCDINDLKHINDTRGHKSGDAFIRAACRMICNVFLHSPVFRLGGDEFAVFVRSNDYDDRETLLKKLRNLSLENMMNSDKPVVATGMAVYDYKHDASFSAVFERADRKMYENKVQLKQDGLKKLLERDFRLDEPIPPARRERLDEMFDALSLAAEGAYVFFCDVRYDYTRWSKAAVGMFDLPSEYLYDAGNVIADRLHPDDRGLYRTSYDAVFAGIASAQDLQFRMKKADGTYEVCTSRSVVLRDQNGDPEYYCGTMRSLGMQGRVDSLTGLRNLYGFFEDLQTNIRSSTESMICLIGVSKFSEINEVYGYQFGNRVLQKFSSHLRDGVGNDGSVYRLDGTKFAVLTELDAQEIRMRYEELRLHCRENFIVDDRSVILDLNAGLLSVDHFDIDYETVYACLNYAHGESKVRRQGDLVEFNSGLNNDNKQRIEKLHAIRASIMQQFYGFYLLYQPVVDAQTEQIIGAEALLRWKSDEYGMVPPDHFIPVLEKDSLFCDLGQWILRTAVRGAKIAMRKHPDFVINVNLSYTQLEKPDFVDMVFSILREEKFPPEHLCLEITERCRLLDMDLLKNVIVNLRGQGVRIALDDFGTGFSSIGLVKNLQFDTIKIDRSFVLRIEEDEKERQLIQAFVGAASTYGAKVCVEGIETEGMRDILQKYHIQSFQGYYYAKPLSLADMLNWEPKKKI